MSVVEQLSQLFAATLVPQHRQQAETALQQAGGQPGFLKGLFEVT